MWYRSWAWVVIICVTALGLWHKDMMIMIYNLVAWLVLEQASIRDEMAEDEEV